MDIDHEIVVIMTMKEFDNYLKVIREFGVNRRVEKESDIDLEPITEE